jgi:hypothetical protein
MVVHRMALFLPGARATMMGAANPGGYTMPEWRADPAVEPLPYSLAGSPAGKAAAGASARTPVQTDAGHALFAAAQRDARGAAMSRAAAELLLGKAG